MQEVSIMPTPGSLTIGILTLNEEKRVSNCLRSAVFADQIVVVDSGSQDSTCEIASAMGAEVYEYTDWQGFGVQRNRLLKHARSEYIFFLDADEEITPNLRDEITTLIATRDFDAAEVEWDVVAFGRPLDRMISSGRMRRLFPTDQLAGFSGAVHEAAVLKPASPRVRRLKHRLLHYTRDSVHGSLQKLAQYTQLGAIKRKEQGKRGGILRGFAAGSTCFFRFYILRLGFLCGGEGFLFCLFVALESFFRYAALKYDSEFLNEYAIRK
jgi:glycosyltransferase involved in cell wall biosynthesis